MKKIFGILLVYPVSLTPDTQFYILCIQLSKTRRPPDPHPRTNTAFISTGDDRRTGNGKLEGTTNLTDFIHSNQNTVFIEIKRSKLPALPGARTRRSTYFYYVPNHRFVTTENGIIFCSSNAT
ncbi:hypothetical protein F5Y02DRAFT_375298 [Annulohypoxylon stygium]|nr:hypothetical protein F5Y02DRAFT_375298 [Annulohypoxylon stygium]